MDEFLLSCNSEPAARGTQSAKQADVKIVANWNEVEDHGQQAVANGWGGETRSVDIQSSNNKTKNSQHNVANAKIYPMQNGPETFHESQSHWTFYEGRSRQ